MEARNFALRKPSNPSRVDAVREIPVKGPWRTKSGGQLCVPYALSIEEVTSFFKYDEQELAAIPVEMRGFRIYTIDGLEPGKQGGGEFHRIRQEVLLATRGGIELKCEDVFGGERTIEVTPEQGVYIPPFILHTYEVGSEVTTLIGQANTIFDPGNSVTHDTFTRDIFEHLQRMY